MALTLEQLRFLRSLEGQALLAAPLAEDDLAALTALRKVCDADQAAAVMVLRGLRQRARKADKLPETLARHLLATDRMVQQASSFRLAAYVAGRLARVGGHGRVLDLCSGMGVDAIAMAVAGLNVDGYDSDPAAVLCAAHNAHWTDVPDRCTFLAVDVAELDIPSDAVVHIDPDRRADGRRAVTPADCAPGEQFLRGLPARTRAGAMKLSPALHDQHVADWPIDRVEYVSEGGVCRQLLLWWGLPEDGPAAGGPIGRRATRVFGGITSPDHVSIDAGLAPPALLAEPGEWLIEPDPAVIAAGGVDDLAASLARARQVRLWRIDPALAWLFADGSVETPLGRCYRVLASVPGRAKDVAKAVADLGGGTVAVKPRGLRLDTDVLQRSLRGPGDRPLVVLWGQIGRRQVAFIAEPPPRRPARS